MSSLLADDVDAEPVDVCSSAGVFTVTSPLELLPSVVESGCRASSAVVEPLTD